MTLASASRLAEILARVGLVAIALNANAEALAIH